MSARLAPGASSAIRVSRRHMRACPACSRNFADPLEQCIQAAEMGEQGRGGLRANAGYARDVVDRVAAQGEVVGNLVRMHAKLLVDAGRAPAQVAGVVPLLVVLAEQLAE